jgi:hypothetical protein
MREKERETRKQKKRRKFINFLLRCGIKFQLAAVNEVIINSKLKLQFDYTLFDLVLLCYSWTLSSKDTLHEIECVDKSNC